MKNIRLRIAAVSAALLLTSHGMASPNQPAEPPSGDAPGPLARTENAVARGAHAAASGVERGVKAAAHGVERGAKAAAHGIERGAKATANAVHRVANKLGGSSASAASSAP